MPVADAPERERFEITVAGELVGFTEYHRGNGSISFVHTEIEPGHEGEGLGSELVATALDTARAEGKPVLPYCPFVQHFIREHPDYLELVPERRRTSFGLGENAG